MFQTIVNAWKIVDIRKKILYTCLIVLIFRIGSAIPVPFTNIGDAGIISDPNAGTFMNYLSMMTGDAFNYGTIFAMSITPYINSSIIMQLLAVAIPALERLQQEGEEGRKKIASITRFVTIALGLLQSTAYFFYLRSQNYIVTDATGAQYTGFYAVFQAIVIIGCLTAGTGLIMWLGERINDNGIGNGISIILFAGIVSRIPTLLASLYGPETGYIRYGGPYYVLSPVVGIIMLLMIAFIVWMDNAERRIPIQYAKRVVGRKMYGGQNTHMPIKVNMSGVMPVIFASSILSLPPTIQMFISSKIEEGSFWDKFFNVFSSKHWAYAIIYFVFIIAFAYFYASIQYNPIEMSKNIRENGGSIPGIRPGEPTARYIGKIIGRITLLGALLLSVVALFPIVFSQVTTFALGKAGYEQGMNISLGGTSIIILVGVALETVKQLESQMMMRHYKGFLD
ncbi:MAG: preprotein translocase subunit SecY [Clostridia bacterium]|nr:preprotein translocase subunit SecY [Clostridia bacterium]MBR5772850.1 preprotein translocase subunit SecY [Clostridia bacterium]